MPKKIYYGAHASIAKGIVGALDTINHIQGYTYNLRTDEFPKRNFDRRDQIGWMATELHDSMGHEIREKAWEYGTTTGRPRRVGWFDGVIYCCRNSCSGLLDFICLEKQGRRV